MKGWPIRSEPVSGGVGGGVGGRGGSSYILSGRAEKAHREARESILSQLPPGMIYANWQSTNI
jgi:hypothetical protein